MLTIPNEIFNSMSTKDIYESSNIDALINDGLISNIQNEIICWKVYHNLSFKQIGVKVGLTTDKTGILFKKALENIKKTLILSEHLLPLIVQLDKEYGILNLNKRKIVLKNRLNTYLQDRQVKLNDTYYEYILNEINLINKQIEIISDIESSDSIRFFNFTSRTANSLYRSGIISIKQLKFLVATDELKNIRNLGQRGVDEVNANLSKLI